jgi:YaiO family outer membrane protein
LETACGRNLIGTLRLRSSLVVLVTLLAARSTLATVPDFDATVREAQGLLRTGQPAEARQLLESLVALYPGNTEAAALLASASEAATLAEARQLRAAGDLRGALARAQTLLDGAELRYDAGLLAAQLHAQLREPREAAALYRELASRYPDDPELPAMQVRALVDAREPQAARAVYDRMPAGSQALATRALGGTNAALYTNSLGVWGLAAQSSAPLPADQGWGALLAQRIARGTLTLFAESDHRFGEQAQQFGGGYEFPVAPAWGAWFTASTSPQRSFLPGSALAASVNRSTARTMSYLTLQQLDFAHSSAFVVAPGFTLHPGETWSLDTRVYYVPGTHAHSFMLAPQWLDGRGNRMRLTLAAGMMGENLGTSGDILRAPTQSLRLEGTWRLDARLGLTAAAFTEHRSGLYDRSGAQLGLAWWW